MSPFYLIPKRLKSLPLAHREAKSKKRHMAYLKIEAIEEKKAHGSHGQNNLQARLELREGVSFWFRKYFSKGETPSFDLQL